MAELKDYWKQTAKSFVLALNDLGVSLTESAKVGIDKAVEWARKDNPHYETTGTEVPTPEDAPAAEAESPAEPEKPEESAEPVQEETAE